MQVLCALCVSVVKGFSNTRLYLPSRYSVRYQSSIVTSSWVVNAVMSNTRLMIAGMAWIQKIDGFALSAP